MLKVFNLRQRKVNRQGYRLLKFLKCQYCSYERGSKECDMQCMELLRQIKGRENYLDDVERENAEMTEE